MNRQASSSRYDRLEKFGAWLSVSLPDSTKGTEHRDCEQTPVSGLINGFTTGS